MSTNYNQYIILGIKVPFDSFTYEQLEDYGDNGYKEETGQNEGITAIFDGMNGKYIIIGKVLYKSEINEPLEGIIDLNVQDDFEEARIAVKLNLLFKINYSNDVKLWLVTHWH